MAWMCRDKGLSTIFDQPLYTLAKLVQWKWPTAYGESVYVVITILAGAYFELVLAFGRERGSLQLKARALPVFHALTGCGHSEGKARNIRRNY